MFKTIGNAFKIPDLRKKLLYTLFIIIIFRVGSHIPVPFLNAEALSVFTGMVNKQDNMIGFLNTLAGGAFSQCAIFAMGVSPYINSSIIMQLLTVAIPALEKLQKEGEEGRKKIAQITRYVTVILGLVQGIAFYVYLLRYVPEGASRVVVQYDTGTSMWFTAVVIVLVFTAGSAIMMWLGEQVNEKGIGNGISILLFSGIVSRMPQMVRQMWGMINTGGRFYYIAPLLLVGMLAIVMFIVFMNDAERRIKVQYAKRVVGRKMYGGQASHIPLKVGLSGVLPIIFASSILGLPDMISKFAGLDRDPDALLYKILNMFTMQGGSGFFAGGWMYTVLYFLLILFFSYFYVSIQYNPMEMANNLRKNNGAVPGIRPGRPTADFIKKVLGKVTLIGALFLSVIALVPIIIGQSTGLYNVGIGGTSVMIMVSVALETMQAIESQMLMRHYKGFLD